MAWAFDPASRTLLPPYVATGAGVGVEVPPSERERQPRAFCTTNFGNFLKVSKDKLTVSYTGSGSHTNDVGAIQADAPAPRATPIAYFEVEVVSAGERGLIGVGFTDASAKLGRQPGWEPGTFGYHGDDGRKYHAKGSGDAYGPRFGAGDVVGAGIDWEAREVFFTKNGRYLGAAFRSSSPPAASGASGSSPAPSSAAATSSAGALTPTTVTTSSLTSGLLYPTIGLHSRGEKVTANFGSAPFRFDVAAAAAAARERRRSAVEAEAEAACSAASFFSSLSSPSSLCADLVRDLLLMSGYGKTLGALDAATAGGSSSTAAATRGGEDMEVEKAAGVGGGGGTGSGGRPGTRSTCSSREDAALRSAAEATLSARSAARRALVDEGDVAAARAAIASVGAGGEIALSEPEVALLLDAQELIESLRRGGGAAAAAANGGKGKREKEADDHECEAVDAALEAAQRSNALSRALGGAGSGSNGDPCTSSRVPPSHSEFARDALALAAYPVPQRSPFAGLASRAQRRAAFDALNAAVLYHAAAAARDLGSDEEERHQRKKSAGARLAPLAIPSSSSWPVSSLERAARQLVAAAAESHFAGGGVGEPFRLEELVPPGAREAAEREAVPLPP